MSFLILLFLAQSVPATTIEWRASVRAEQFARGISRMERPEDMLRWKLSGSDAARIKDELRKGVYRDFQKPKVRKLSATSLEVHRIVIEFRNIRKGQITVAGKAISLTKGKTAVNYTAEIRAAVRAQHATGWLLPYAHADVDDCIAAILGVGVSQTAKVEFTRDENLAIDEVLIESYNTQGLMSDSDSEFPRFQCAGTELVQVSEGPTVWRRNAKGDFEITLNGCKKTTNANWIVQQSTCGGVGESMAEAAPFWGFQNQARACCEKTGCEPKVRAALDQLLKELGASPQTAQ